MDLRVLATSGLVALVLLPGASAGPGATARVSVTGNGAQADSHSLLPAIDGAGRIVAFYSDATNLVPGDTNNARDVFARDRQAGTTVRVSVDSAGTQANSQSFAPAVSRDGRVVAFHSDASNLVPGDANNASDVFVHDRQSRATTRVSVATGGAEGNGSSSAPALSADGRFVTFVSDATNLVTGDTNFARDVFLHDRQTGTTTRISVSTAGDQGNIHSLSSAISDDGRFVAFSSYAANLVAGDTNESADIFVRDRQDNSTSRVSVYSDGTEVEGDSLAPAISADGRVVAFDSDAWLLIWGDTNEARDIFVYDRQNGLTTRVSVDDGGDAGERREPQAVDHRRRPLRRVLLRGVDPGRRRLERRLRRLHSRPPQRRDDEGERRERRHAGERRQRQAGRQRNRRRRRVRVRCREPGRRRHQRVQRRVHPRADGCRSSSPAPPPARCVVPNVRWKKLAVARRSITAARCRVGRVRQARSKRVRRGRVISQSPAARTRARVGFRVNLVVSRGRR